MIPHPDKTTVHPIRGISQFHRGQGLHDFHVASNPMVSTKGRHDDLGSVLSVALEGLLGGFKAPTKT